MNFFRATVAAPDGRPVADAGFARIPLNGGGAAAMGKDVIVGLRPEDIHDLGHATADRRLPVDATVEVVEYLGNELQLYLAAGDARLIARVSPDTRTQPGAPIRVGFDLRKIHLFDSGTEAAIR